MASAPASDAFAEPSPPFRPWRIDFARPELIEYPAVPEPSITESPDSANVAKRLLLLLGLAYLFIAALTSGLAYTGYLTVPENNRNITRRTGNSDTSDTNSTGDSADSAAPAEGALPPKPPAPRPPSRHPNAPGLHTRPDGSRYLIMPLPADLADRLRGQASTDRAAVPAAVAMGGAL